MQLLLLSLLLYIQWNVISNDNIQLFQLSIVGLSVAWLICILEPETPQPILPKPGPINPGDDDYYTHYYQFSQMVDEDGWNPPTFQTTKMIHKSYRYNCNLEMEDPKAKCFSLATKGTKV